ncbi:MAG: NAD(P)/FAD-dependent oxidoreductase [Pseudomonadota bacterium]
MERLDAVVIGAGVVGLAVGRALALAGRDVVILEQHDTFGAETSSRNSEVIHAGLYYRPGGLRATLCVCGKQLLYQYCRERHIPHLQCEKLVVGHGAGDIDRLRALQETARQNGVDDVTLISGVEATQLEPALTCDAALHSPSTGIIDSHTLMVSLFGDIEDAGGTVAFNASVIAGSIIEGGVGLSIGGGETFDAVANLVVNCAGLHADKVARSITGLNPQSVPTIRPAKGQYFSYSGPAPFTRLIYPLHTKDSQGVHYTRDLAGQARLGPDIRWDAPLGDYAVDEARKEYFADSVRRFWRDIDADRLHPGYAGQRPKAGGPGEEGDFIIAGPDAHGATGYVGLYAIESPGLTACLAIGRYVAAMVGGS